MLLAMLAIAESSRVKQYVRFMNDPGLNSDGGPMLHLFSLAEVNRSSSEVSFVPLRFLAPKLSNSEQTEARKGEEPSVVEVVPSHLVSSHGRPTWRPARRPGEQLRAHMPRPDLEKYRRSSITLGEGTTPPPRLPSLPCGDKLDKRILKLAVPAIVNFLILPFTGAVDLFWIGRIGDALANAGQGAADQVYNTGALLTNVIPFVTVPIVAEAYAAGNQDGAVQRQVGGAIFLSIVLSLIVTLLTGVGSDRWLTLLGSSAALHYSRPYLLGRLPGVVPDAISTVGFASFRGMQDVVTPLMISFVASMVNLVLDPLFMFKGGLGIAGAALATSASQLFSGSAYLWFMLRRNLVKFSTLLRPPSKELLQRIAAAGGAVQVRNIALNLAYAAITKTVQGLDTTGVSAAAHAVTLALWRLGGVVLFAMSSVGTILTSAEIGKKHSTPDAARAVARRVLSWGALLGGSMGLMQLLGLPLLCLFTPLPEVRKAARTPSIIGAALQFINGIVYVGEGLMVSAGAYKKLAVGAVTAALSFLLALRLTPSTLTSVWLCFWVFNGVRLANFVDFFWFTKSPLLLGGNSSHAVKESAP